MIANRLNFVYTSWRNRVVFGEGAITGLSDELASAGLDRVLVVCTPQQRALAELVQSHAGKSAVAIFDEARMHVPASVVRSASEVARSANVQGVVAAGGGSTIGLAKMLALHEQIPYVAVPTTYAGSEMTPIYGITAMNEKRTGRDERVLPKTVIYDPSLTLDLPWPVSVSSGLNAIAHAAEGLYAFDSNPILQLMAEEGIRAMANGMRQLATKPHDIEARGACLYGAWLCGSVLGQAGMAIHHKLCHVLGGSLDLPHAETHAVMLPHTIGYNAEFAPGAMARIRRALNAEDAAMGLYELGAELGSPCSLRDLGVQERELSRIVDVTIANPYWNPRPLERSDLMDMLYQAWRGDPPARA
ncbi:maleylacetate reductase [Paraburkholderia sp. RL17-347-BIC-D]|uniref:maleylacetate reductase n=1 Tax=Paraburkholderia sp. RL17-347-BIC-D TaxID=3031632 RepID=UPI0038BB774F